MKIRASVLAFLTSLSSKNPWSSSTRCAGTVHALSSTSSPAIASARCLGGTDLVVSEACLGTMTFGVQNTLEDATAQLDFARSEGVNFIDTAELYPVPLTAPEWRPGATEEIVGKYVNQLGSSERDELVIASKVAGFFPDSPIVPARYEGDLPSGTNPDCRLDAPSLRAACEASLRRLQTDRIDLYQVHWPDRYVPVFGQTEFKHELKRDGDVPIEETVAALRDLIEEGKVRYIGISNESCFGVSKWVEACEKYGIRDKLASIQNSYSLVDRRFDSELSEICDAHKIGLLPWSILAGGLLSGKYQKKSATATPSCRFVKYPEYMSRWSPQTARPETLDAVDGYVKIAQEAGMSPAQLAIEFVRSRNFVNSCGSTIVGATTLEQLKDNLAPFQSPVDLSDDIVNAINDVHMGCRDPSCSL